MATWGKRWGNLWVTDTGRAAEMRRRGQRCRFFDVETGEQIGPEQSNVAPAFAAARAAGWDSGLRINWSNHQSGQAATTTAKPTR